MPFKLIRRDADFLRKGINQKEHFLLISGRIEIILDLTGVEGDIIVTNSAVTPYPVGTAPDRFTSQMLKIVVNKSSVKGRYLQSLNF